jgi:hypothetical protein
MAGVLWRNNADCTPLVLTTAADSQESCSVLDRLIHTEETMLGDGIRRDISTISDEERTLFVNAIRKLDDPTSVFVYPNNPGNEAADAGGNITYWDMQEQIHKDAHFHGVNVHSGPAFTPWHRDMVNHLGMITPVARPAPTGAPAARWDPCLCWVSNQTR